MGLLCIHGNTRYHLADSPQLVDLFNGTEFIAAVELSTDLAGDKNGYITNAILVRV